MLEKDKWIVMEYVRGENSAKEFWQDAWPLALDRARKQLKGENFRNAKDEEIEKMGPFIILIATHAVSGALDLSMFVIELDLM